MSTSEAKSVEEYQAEYKQLITDLDNYDYRKHTDNVLAFENTYGWLHENKGNHLEGMEEDVQGSVYKWMESKKKFNLDSDLSWMLPLSDEERFASLKEKLRDYQNAAAFFLALLEMSSATPAYKALHASFYGGNSRLAGSILDLLDAAVAEHPRLRFRIEKSRREECPLMEENEQHEIAIDRCLCVRPATMVLADA